MPRAVRPQPAWLWAAALALCVVAGGVGGCEELSATTEQTDAAADSAEIQTDTADTSPGEDVIVVPDPAGGVTPLLDLGAAMAGDPKTFFSFPFPSDARTSLGGFPILAGFQTRNSPLLQDAVAWLEQERPGFSPSTALYFAFNGQLDPRTLPQTATEAAAESASVFVINVSPDSPDFGKRHPVDMRFTVEDSNFTPANLLTVSVVMGVPLRSATRYVAVVTNQVKSAAGNPLTVPPDIAAAQRQQAQGEVGTHLNAAMQDLTAAGVDVSTVVAASAFTTSDVMLDMKRIRAWLYTQPAPVVGQWTRATDLDLAGSYEVYTARVDLTEFFSGAPPYTSEFGEGAFLFDSEGLPLNGKAASVRVALTIPAGQTMPAGGWPLVIYGHGTGGDVFTQLGNSYEADFLAREGIAMIGFDAPLHGERGTGEIEPDVLLLANAVAGRELFRQHAVDLFTMFRLQDAGGFDIPADVTGGAAITFNQDLDLYMGHSQGSQIAGLTLPLEPNIGAAFFSEGGGGGVLSVFDREFNGEPIICTLSTLIRTPCESVTEDHPMPRLLLQPLLDSADPVIYARHYIHEPLLGDKPKHLALTEGTADPYTPPRAIEALTAAAGLPLIEPVVQTSAPLDISQNPRQQPPQTLNVTGGGGVKATAGLMQWEGEGHFVIYRKADARNRYVQFFKSAVSNGGTPTIVGP